MTNIESWKEKQEVSGTYCGVDFVGRINSNESRHSPGQAFIFVVDLERPIMVFGEIRNQIEIWSNGSNPLELQ